MPLTQVSPGLLDSNAQYYGFKNRIINGAMGIWQRGTSFSNPTTTNFYTADRWGVNRAGDVTGATVSRSTSAPTGFQYSLSLQRTAGNTSTAGLYLFNSNETVNTLDLAGQTVTLSFWARAGANYSGGALQVIVGSGTGTDQRIYAYTGSLYAINTTQVITTAWTRYSFTGTIDAAANEVGSFLAWFPTGTAGADDAVYVTGVQLEKGSTATSFDYRPYELQLCQRYYYRLSSSGTAERWGAGFAANTATGQMIINFPCNMRVAPSALEQSGTASHYALSSNAGTTVANGVPLFVNASTNAACLNLSVASITSGASILGIFNNASAYLGWSSEL
jgi:hypothetical protein